MDVQAAAYTAYKQKLRRTYAGDVAGLRALSDQLDQELSDTVTITSQSFEGGSHSGQITMSPGLKLKAVEELIAEMDSTGSVPRAPRSSVTYFR